MAAPDVVVVGGGAAGCVMATRLSQAGKSVLLLEAGPDRREDLPGYLRNGWTIEREPFDWGFMAEPDANHKPRPVRRKKLLGGTGWLTRFTPRGSPTDYDGWAIAGWTFDELLPYFRRLESDGDFGHEPWHGDTGPLPSNRYFEMDLAPVTQAAVDGLLALGHPWVDDHNCPGAIGVGRMPMNTVNGRRVTTADAYLPLADPTRLTIQADSLVSDVLFEGATAAGVRLADGTIVRASAVVLCAGVYGSPAILLRSGLDSRGIGDNLCDHTTVELDLGYRGPAAKGAQLHTITSFRSEETGPEAPPDLLFWIADPSGDPPSASIELLLMKPRSRGSVRLRSKDPAVAPVITLPNCDDDSDVRRLAEGYRHAVELATRPELRRFCPEPVIGRGDDDWIRANATSVPHVVGTCALGAVVDADGLVSEHARLWVADASVIPDAPSGFVHVPTVMLAERLSERVASQL